MTSAAARLAVGVLALCGLFGAPSLAQAGEVAALRLAHLAPALGTVRLELAGALERDPISFNPISLDPGEVSAYALLPAGTPALALATQDAERLELAPDLAPGRFYTLLLVPGEEGPGWALLGDTLELPEAGHSSLRLVNASAQGALSLLAERRSDAEDEPEGGDVGTGTRLRVQVMPEDSTVSVTGPDGFSETFSGSRTLQDLRAGTFTVVATRAGHGSEAVQAEVMRDARSDVTLHLRPLAGDPDPAWSSGEVRSGEASPYQPLARGRYRASVQLGSRELARLEDWQPQPGASYSLYLYDLPDGNLGLAVSLDALVQQEP